MITHIEKALVATLGVCFPLDSGAGVTSRRWNPSITDVSGLANHLARLLSEVSEKSHRGQDKVKLFRPQHPTLPHDQRHHSESTLSILSIYIDIHLLVSNVIKLYHDRCLHNDLHTHLPSSA